MSNSSEFEIQDGVLIKYNGRAAGTVVIPDGVVKIGDWAFRDCFISGVTFPESVKIIGEGAFAENIIDKVEIPQTVTEIGNFAFAGNYLLKSASISGGVAALPHGIFNNCMQLAYVTLSEGLMSIGESAFLGCLS